MSDAPDKGRPGKAGRIMFVLYARFPSSPYPSRRALGLYGALSLAQAREKATEWLALIRKGVDPAVVEEQARKAALRQQALARERSFAAVAEAFIADKLPGERKGREVERDLRNVFLPAWGNKAIDEITDLDVLVIINAKKRSAPAQARNLLGTVKRFFTWAVDQRVYGLKTSPADGLRPGKIIGEKARGERVLSDDELFALWRAAERTPYPYGPVYKLLVLTALRLNEAADAARPEFDFPNRLWTIPAVRMKGKKAGKGQARPHAVPLTDDMLAILQKLPRFKQPRGDFLFSTTIGKSPVWMSDKVKKRIDRRMLRTLRALARRRGDDPAKVKLAHWVNHDIRRTVRSNLSRLKIAEEAREAVLAHARPGIKGTYDLHDYLDEKREASGIVGSAAAQHS